MARLQGDISLLSWLPAKILLLAVSADWLVAIALPLLYSSTVVQYNVPTSNTTLLRIDIP